METMSSTPKRPEIDFSEEQAMLLDLSRRFAAERSDFADVRKRMAAETDLDSALWQEMVEMGWTGLLVPEEFGGSGLGLDALVPIVESTGRHLLASPLVSTALATRVLICAGSMAQQATWLPRIAEGAVATVAVYEPGGAWDLTTPGLDAKRDGDKIRLTGTKVQVADAGVADLILVSAELDGQPIVVAVDGAAAAPSRHLQKIYDETRRCYKISFDGLAVPADAVLSGGDAVAALRQLERTGELLLGAEMTGGLAGTLELILDYIKTREAFGRPIGQFQSIKHPTAEILLSLEAARTLLYYASTQIALDPTGQETELATRMLKAHVSEAFAHAGDRAIQFHGGIGFTHECNAQLFLRRALWSQAMFGDARYHRRKLAPLLLD